MRQNSDFPQWLDAFFRRHPRLMTAATVLLCVAAVIAVLAVQPTTILYQNF